MSSSGAQKITVRHEGTDRVFDSSQHVTLGRAPEVTLFVDSPLVSRVHATLAWHGGAWVLSDNGSTNGVFVDAQRLTRPVSINRPVLVRLGDAVSGPLLHLVPAAGVRPVAPPPPSRSNPSYSPGPQGRPPTPPPGRPPAPPQHSGPPQRPRPNHQPPQPVATTIEMTTKADTSALPPVRARARTAPVARADRIPAAGLAIGRTGDNQIVVNDPLASRRHARLISDGTGLAIEDLGSANGTFVNGRREQRSVLRERDIVTIGNIDFVVHEGTLVHRKKPVAEQGLHVHGIGFAVEGNKQLLVDVNMQAGRGTLTALIGPSGAGKSTLSKLVAGTTHPSAGVVTFEGRNLHAEYEAMRSRIGMVPQDDVLHRQLTVRQALGFAAELRLPPDSSKQDRQRVIDGVLKELSLTEHADTRVDRLSGGQRKRASVALELLTGPALLLLDEPTSGLDPALDRQVMTMLRELADAGRTVIVVTHSVACLDMCDQVLLLAPGGKTAFCGHPAAVGDFLGTNDWAEIFARVAADPDRAFANYRSRQASVPPPPPVAPRGVAGQPPKSDGRKQFSTLSRRQVRLILADRGYLAFLVVLPFVLGVLSLVVPGKNGFAPGPLVPMPDGTLVSSGGGETQQLLVVLILGACFMGSTLTVRDLVGERPIFHRERAVGLLPSAYLLAKITVFGAAALLQSAVLVGIVLAGKNPPGKGTLIPSGSAELYIDLAFTAVTCVVIGLLLSTVAKSNEQVMPLLVVVIMCQLVMAGGMIPVTNRVVLEQLSYLFPSRWGFAAGSSTVDLRALFVNAQPDALWQHKSGFWLLDIGMLLVLTAALAGLTWSRLRLKKSAA
ncbi:FHA domain-containing protein [Nocardia terpenica]|uniref:ABC transporter n=1 Tax=Nocardia terpenica TaxID=455432 RepID=A0A164I9V9_9NOCA|nr:FHA domain-containing protein [Nocardia terpenica]KZM69232.1 ABC transporter [Nocardia terpenica]NQE87641.1 ATP-binding cassette domain-containing protein [Nocardia terpenica]